MKANYHTHTARCHHASGTEREYVEAAIKSGIKVLGFSDHTPYPFPENHCHGIRMRMSELESYVNTILALRDEYQGDIEIHLGLEVEYFPAYFEQLCKEVSDYPIEYFLLAQHYLGNGVRGEVFCGSPTMDVTRLTTYCTQVIAGIETGCFSCLAHPDLIHFEGDDDFYAERIRRVCRSTRDHGLSLEINFLGLSEGRHYPDERFWKIAGEEGCDVIFGLDAHKPEQFLFEKCLVKAQEIVKRYDLHLLENMELKKPF